MAFFFDKLVWLCLRFQLYVIKGFEFEALELMVVFHTEDCPCKESLSDLLNQFPTELSKNKEKFYIEVLSRSSGALG